MNEARIVIYDFLESSSINGLNQVASARGKHSKLAWTFAILFGFSMAFYIIQYSFEGWALSPIITTVETLPISKVRFPIVTICPPKDTNTALNYDIRSSINVTLDNVTRFEAIKETKGVIYKSILSGHVKDNENWQEDEDEVKKIFDGETELPMQLVNGTAKYTDEMIVRTSGMLGSVRSPNYQEPFDVDRYDFEAKFRYQIEIEKDISPNTMIELKIDLDTKEGIYYEELMHGNVKLKDEYDILTIQKARDDLAMHNSITDDLKSYYNSGKRTFERVLPVESGLIIELKYERKIYDQMKQWKNPRETGFSLRWKLQAPISNNDDTSSDFVCRSLSNGILGILQHCKKDMYVYTSSPNFGNSFPLEGYQQSLSPKYKIDFPQVEAPQQVFAALHLEIDTKKELDRENKWDYVKITYGSEILKYKKTGKVNVTKRIENVGLVEKETKYQIEIHYRRFLLNTEDWKDKRETGYRLKWRFEDVNGIPIATEPLFAKKNSKFREWVKLFYHLRFDNGIEISEIEKSVRNIKISQFEDGYEAGSPEQRDSPADFNKESITIDSLKRHFSMADWEASHVMIQNQTNNRNLNGEWLDASRLYLMICHRESPFKSQHYKLIRFSENLFKFGSPKMIAQAILLNLNGKNTLHTALPYRVKDTFIQVIGWLYHFLDTHFHWRLGIIDIGSSSKSTLKKTVNNQQLVPFNEAIVKCLESGDCLSLPHITDDLDVINDISNHPPHILNSNKKLSPSAFIPFCQFSNQALGSRIKQFSDRICTNFKEVLQDNQRCYYIDVNSIKRNNEEMNEKEMLVVLLDYNLERSSVIDDENRPTTIDEDTLGLKIVANVASGVTHMKKATLYLNTIKEYSSQGGGNYEMSSVKEVKTTANFNNFDEVTKQCQNRHSFTECKQDLLVSYLRDTCSCSPPALAGLETVAKVNLV